MLQRSWPSWSNIINWQCFFVCRWVSKRYSAVRKMEFLVNIKAAFSHMYLTWRSIAQQYNGDKSLTGIFHLCHLEVVGAMICWCSGSAAECRVIAWGCSYSSRNKNPNAGHALDELKPDSRLDLPPKNLGAWPDLWPIICPKTPQVGGDQNSYFTALDQVEASPILNCKYETC